MSTLFFSYSREDVTFVERVEKDLEALGHTVRRDRRALQGASPFTQQIKDQISGSDFFVLFWTPRSSRSKWVKKELNHALAEYASSLHAKVVPILRDKKPESLPKKVRRIQVVEFSDEQYSLSLAQLAQALPLKRFDEIEDLKHRLRNEVLDGDTTLLHVLKKASVTRRDWRRARPHELAAALRRMRMPGVNMDDVFYWCVAYGVLEFKGIETWFRGGGKTIADILDHVEVAPRGKGLLNELAGL
jgi:hypothetical protein